MSEHVGVKTVVRAVSGAVPPCKAVGDAIFPS